MKQVVLILALFAFSCSDDDPTSETGCLTGIPSGSTDRVLIKCATREQFLAGSNVSAGGTSSWNAFTQHQWAKCSDCK